MSGHRSEASIRSYSRDCSTNQKRNISDTLSKPTTSYIPQTSLESSIANHLVLQESATLHPQKHAIFTQSISNTNTNTLSSSSISTSNGFLHNASFNNCQISFNLGNSTSPRVNCAADDKFEIVVNLKLC